LDGASSPEALVAGAQALGLAGLALTDHDSLAGAVRFWTAARQAELPAIIGAEVTLADGHHLTLLAENQAGYGNLCRLITLARGGGRIVGGEEWWTLPIAEEPLPDPQAMHSPPPWPGKVEPALPWAQLAEHHAGLIALSGCRQGPVAAALLQDDPDRARQRLLQLREIFGPDHCFVEVQHHALPDDDRLLRRLIPLARRAEIPLVATNNVHYATPDGSRLRDALIAIRHSETLTAARRAGRLPLNSRYALTGPEAMARRFAELPDALAATAAIAARCRVSLDFSAVRLPQMHAEPGGPSAFEFLYRLCHENLAQRYPALTPRVIKQLAHELEIIERAGLADYFLIVWDIVRFARENGIRCQGRGSAANSIVAYLLGITSIDPIRHDLLFERFLSSDKFTMPDIDIDFAADRREEVIQYVYRRYGHEHVAMVCNVVTYRARSALRDLGKALDFPQPTIERLLQQIDTNSPKAAAEQLGNAFELTIDNRQSAMVNGQLSLVDSPQPLSLLLSLLAQIDGCPRHLSIHSGGMLITGRPLNAIVPLEPATMPGRVVCQWDKDSVEDAGLIKIDLLGLRMLGLLEEALDHVAVMGDELPDLDGLALDDPAIYAMLQRGDTIGAFQVESRAQQQMLPQLKPACFEDIAIEVAIVRPGPIQGGAVHPYLRRRAGVEEVSYLHASLEPVLAETLGVLLFQEQAIRVAMTSAGFTPGEADLLRRAMSRSRSEEAMAAMAGRFVAGAQARGIDEATAAAIFEQLAGFACYGFCKSHAASFALIAYQSMYLKRYQAPAFYCALFNQQPMGFYSAEVIAGDARRHGVALLPPVINRSEWRHVLEQDEGKRWAIRTGLQAVHGLGEQAGARIVAARAEGLFTDLVDCCRRTRLERDVVSNLIRAGVLDEFGARRDLLWQLGDVDLRPDELPLTLASIAAELPPLDALEETAWEYELLGLSPAGQVMRHYRGDLRKAGILSTWQVKQARPGQRVRVAGMVVVRQRPGTAKGILFMSLEDESGLLDLVVKPPVYARLRTVLRGQPLLLVEGVVQRAERAASLLVGDAHPL
jgi:error-prone DNA polymerase